MLDISKLMVNHLHINLIQFEQIVENVHFTLIRVLDRLHYPVSHGKIN